MAEKNFLQRNEKLIIWAGMGAVVYFGLIKPVLIKFGVARSKDEKKADKKVEDVYSLPDNQNPFSPSYFEPMLQYILNTNPKATVKLWTDKYVTQTAVNIHKALGYVYDEEDEVFGPFRDIPSQIIVGQVARKFYQIYNKDLWTYLDEGDAIWWWSGLSHEELARVKDIVFSKPLWTKL